MRDSVLGAARAGVLLSAALLLGCASAPALAPSPAVAPHQRSTPPASSTTFYVATNGNDGNPGSQVAPWRTIQKAANSATPGSTVEIRGGSYAERVTVNVSGGASTPIVFQSAPGEVAVIDASNLTVPSGQSALITISGRSNIMIKGLELRNYRTSLHNCVPIGIVVDNGATNISMLNNRIHHIETTYSGVNGGDAHAIAVYGNSGTQAISGLVIDGNQIHDLKLGSSEALVINGNVDGWQVTNNLVYNSTNIAIDAIGYEGVAPSNDRARNGTIAGNRVWNIDARSNPAYGATCSGGVCSGGEPSAGGIYVDGGTQIVIERNLVVNSNIGIELASEHAGKSTDFITVRNNIVADTNFAGLAMGGYAADASGPGGGNARHNTVVNNTVYTLAERGGDPFGHADALHAQYRVQNNSISNNIFAAGSSAQTFVQDSPDTFTGNTLSANLSPVVSAGAPNPGGLFVSVAVPSPAALADWNSRAVRDFLHLAAGSAALDAGAGVSFGAIDIDGQPRLAGSAVDIGADERP